MSTKPRHSHDDETSDQEEDNCSLASSTATSARTNKFKATVPVGPRFICGERLGKRKEYYAKLEEKHKALEKEKQEAEARQKEEEDAAIKQMRKSMVYKANPVPSFYRDGPPPKVKLKKLPLTRPVSPKLTRRRSCGDAGKPEDRRLQERATRQSAAAKGKERVDGRKSDEDSKTKDDSQEQKLVDNDVES
ncbi:TPX2 protein for protein family [Perilla frutescens var. frutescens]|nr:TPX2 protein for protein family [Perilla frutescens var. frutescens]